MPPHDRLEPFNNDGPTWPVYEQQVPVFVPNDAHIENQRDLFLVSCETRRRSLLLELLRLSTPFTQTFDELLSTMRAHYSPTPSTTMEPFCFNNGTRRDS